MSSPEQLFDRIRAKLPELGLALYAIEPRGVVTFEVIDETGELFSFTGLTALEAIERAFPPPPEPAESSPAVVLKPTADPPKPPASVFD